MQHCTGRNGFVPAERLRPLADATPLAVRPSPSPQLPSAPFPTTRIASGWALPSLLDHNHSCHITAAAPSTPRRVAHCSAYSRTSWREAILAEESASSSSAASGSNPRSALSSHEDASSSPHSNTSGDSSAASHSSGDGSAAQDGVYGSTVLDHQGLRVKLSLAAGCGRLDLTDCRLEVLPPEVLELTDLEELQLSGNCLAELPDGISRLTGLRRLGLAGNCLRALPPGLGALRALEGLWLHGNLLEGELPAELGGLAALRALSLAGNRLTSVAPGALSGLSSLTDLTLAGNRLCALPPGELAPLTALRKLSLAGNRLATCPDGLGARHVALAELMLQGNALREVHPGVFECKALAELSLADNRLASLPAALSGASSLARLHLFGNGLRRLPVGQLASLPSLSDLWLEGNPGLDAGDLGRLVEAAGAGGMPRLKALGMDQQQAALLSDSQRRALPRCVRVGCVLGSGPGYFKLQYGPGAGPAQAAGSTSRGGASWAPGESCGSRNSLLVVSFGSAPGTPNWGGLLSKVYKAATSDAERAFDVLYVADPYRDWYGGGTDDVQDDGERDPDNAPPPLSYYRTRLESYTRQYRRVLMLGDSMGATATLLCADLATAALAFCPQVDLTEASIRPGRPAPWLAALRTRLMEAVRRSPPPPSSLSHPPGTPHSGAAAAAPTGTELTVLVGTWQHDLDQANSLPQKHQQGREQLQEQQLGGAGGGRALAGWRDAGSGGGAAGGWRSQQQQQLAGATARRSPWAWQEQGVQAGNGARGPQVGEGSGREDGVSGSVGEGGGGYVTVRVFSVDSHRLAAALDARGQLVPLVREAVLRQLGIKSANVRISNLL